MKSVLHPSEARLLTVDDDPGRTCRLIQGIDDVEVPGHLEIETRHGCSGCALTSSHSFSLHGTRSRPAMDPVRGDRAELHHDYG